MTNKTSNTSRPRIHGPGGVLLVVALKYWTRRWRHGMDGMNNINEYVTLYLCEAKKATNICMCKHSEHSPNVRMLHLHSSLTLQRTTTAQHNNLKYMIFNYRVVRWLCCRFMCALCCWTFELFQVVWRHSGN